MGPRSGPSDNGGWVTRTVMGLCSCTGRGYLGGIAALTVLLAMATVYAYGKGFSHDRYWHGTTHSDSHTRIQTLPLLSVKIIV